MKNILNRGFSKTPLPAFVAKVQTIIAQLTGNTHFPTTDPTVAAVTTKLGELTTAMSNPNPAARNAGINAARPQLESMLDDLADNLEKTAGGDYTKLATTGFDTRKTSAGTGEAPAIPGNLRLKLTGTSGEVQAMFDASDRARSYEVQVALDPNNGSWTLYDTYTSTRNVILRAQPRAKDIWVRVRALGPNNTKSGWSDPATILVA